MKAFLLNLVVAAIWVLLQAETTFFAFATGLGLGFAMLALFRDVLGSRDYVRRVLAAAAFLLLFTKEFLTSCWQLIGAILWTPADQLCPRIITYDISGLSRVEALLLSHCISLTPGTTTVDISPDLKRFTLHVLACRDPEAVRATLDRTLRRGILAFTR
ncbi:MAG TPA: Na+/H+ antiporter subunit E [Opitutaceae bacterium]